MGERDGAGGVSDFVQRRPAAPLRPYVAWYSGYRQVGVEPGTHRGLPSPYLTVIVTLDDPLVVAAHPDPRTPAGRYDTLVGGLHTTPAIITHDGRQSGVQLALSPLGARALLGLPAGELVHVDLDGREVLGPFARELRERLLAGVSWAERFTTLNVLLTRRLEIANGPPGIANGPRDEVAWAWRRLRASGGTVPVKELAREVGWSGRHLSQQFRTETGLSPKGAARVVRFDRTRRLLQRQAASGQPPTLADLATTCGYYDQAHLAREFREFAGCSASRWLTEEFRNVQVIDAWDGEDCEP
ncbi:helix-turn-helix domain-containing protein [Micromonospora pisi]|uniref:helix-turn-helix domain-containing protein n=1 Tax=Micromonospora pisi TaxID=589240 RepID=UPI001B882E2E|nr:helix-turn-helix domain-containing protein [Micromonospora pisi]